MAMKPSMKPVLFVWIFLFCSSHCLVNLTVTRSDNGTFVTCSSNTTGRFAAFNGAQLTRASSDLENLMKDGTITSFEETDRTMFVTFSSSTVGIFTCSDDQNYLDRVIRIVATIENILSNVISLSWSKLPFPSYANIMYCVSAYFRNLTTQESRPLDERCTSDNNSFLCLSDTSTVSNKLSCKEVNISVTPYIQNFPREPASELSVSALTGIKAFKPFQKPLSNDTGKVQVDIPFDNWGPRCLVCENVTWSCKICGDDVSFILPRDTVVQFTISNACGEVNSTNEVLIHTDPGPQTNNQWVWIVAVLAVVGMVMVVVAIRSLWSRYSRHQKKNKYCIPPNLPGSIGQATSALGGTDQPDSESSSLLGQPVSSLQHKSKSLVHIVEIGISEAETGVDNRGFFAKWFDHIGWLFSMAPISTESDVMKKGASREVHVQATSGQETTEGSTGHCQQVDQSPPTEGDARTSIKWKTKQLGRPGNVVDTHMNEIGNTDKEDSFSGTTDAKRVVDVHGGSSGEIVPSHDKRRRSTAPRSSWERSREPDATSDAGTMSCMELQPFPTPYPTHSQEDLVKKSSP